MWENEDIVEGERWRNIGIVFAFVFVSTLLFLGNLPISLMVILCVVLTIIDTVGFNHFWGVKMYFVTITYTTMAVGLCVDYSVHIAYSFIMSEGTVHIKYNTMSREFGQDCAELFIYLYTYAVKNVFIHV